MARRRKSKVKLGVGALVALTVIGSVFGGSDSGKSTNRGRGNFGADSSTVSQQEESKDTSSVQIGDKTYTTDPAPSADPPAETVDSTGNDTDASATQPDGPPADDTPAQQDATPAQQDDGQSSKVYVGSTDSDKYHKPTCRHAKKILESNQRWFASAEEAVSAGYSPCGTCKPKS